MKAICFSFVLIVCLTLIEFHAITVIHENPQGGSWLTRIPQMAEAIAKGNFESPHVAQRILLSKLLLFVAETSKISFKKVWIISVFILLLSVNTLTYYLLLPYTTNAAFFTIAQAAAFVCTQDWFELPPYDLVDNFTWMLFAYGIFSKKNWTWFAVLFVIELHNREVAIFFPLWLVISNLIPFRLNSFIEIWKRLTIAFGAILCILFGLIYTVWLRKHCNVNFVEVAGAVGGTPINWPYNWVMLQHPWPFTDWFVPVKMWHNTRYGLWACFASVGLTIMSIIYMQRSWFKLQMLLFFAAFWVTIFYSAAITEARAYYCLTPIILCVFFWKNDCIS